MKRTIASGVEQGKDKKRKNTKPLLSLFNVTDICGEIIQFLESDFIVRNCLLISKKFQEAVLERSTLVFKFTSGMTREKALLLTKVSYLSRITVMKIKQFGKTDWDNFSILMTHITQMLTMKLEDCYFDQKVAEYFMEWKQITSLDIDIFHLNKETITYFKQLHKETKINAYFIYNANTIPQDICELKQLKKLCIRGKFIALDELEAICKIEQLEELVISNNNIDEVGFKLMSQLRKLTSLNISHSIITENGLKHLSELKQLTKLYLMSCDINLQAATVFRNFTQLTSLDISSNNIDENIAKSISNMKQLTRYW